MLPKPFGRKYTKEKQPKYTTNTQRGRERFYSIYNMYMTLKTKHAQEYHALKRKYEQVFGVLESGELSYCELKKKMTETGINSETDNNSNSVSSATTTSIDKSQVDLWKKQLKENNELILELREENEKKRKRIETLEQSILLVHQIQDENAKLMESNVAYKEQYEETFHLLEISSNEQEKNNLDTIRYITNFINEVNSKFIYSFERNQSDMENGMRRLLNMSNALKQQNAQLTQKNESITKSLRQRDKEVDDLHLQLANMERKHQDVLNKTKMQYEDKIVQLSSELDQTTSLSLEMYKKRVMQQKIEYEREIADLKNQLATSQGNSSVNSSKINATLQLKRSSTTPQQQPQLRPSLQKKSILTSLNRKS